MDIELYENDSLHGEAFNFGPRAEQNHTVEELLIDLSKYWDFKDVNEAYIPFHEAGLLKQSTFLSQMASKYGVQRYY